MFLLELPALIAEVTVIPAAKCHEAALLCGRIYSGKSSRTSENACAS